MELPVSAISANIKRGDIFHASFEGIDHGKFFVVMGVSSDCLCGFFFINSNINKFIFQKQELLELQYQIRHGEYDFLKYDSFVCASNVKVMSLKRLTEGILRREIEIVGCLKNEHVNDILEMVRNSRIINKSDKKKFFL